MTLRIDAPQGGSSLGGDARRNSTPRYEVTFDLERASVIRFGPLGANVRDLSTGREWSVLVVAEDGAPAFPTLTGGASQKAAAPPATLLEPIYGKLRRLWK